MIPFEWLEPASMNEAVDLLDDGDEATRPVSGGTALMLMMKAGVFAPSRLVSLHRIERHYAELALTDRNLEVGALATLASLERSAEVAAAFPVIAATMARLSNPRVRNVACVGGALAHGDPHMDLPPIMAALDASVTTMGPAMSRTLRVDELYAGYYETALARNELICSVTVPRRFNRRAAYLKMTARTADDWPALGVAVAFTRHGETLADVRVVVSAATPMVMRLRTAEAVLEGAAPDDEALRAAGEAASSEAPVMGNARGSRGYKRELLRVCVGRAFRQALAGPDAH